MSPTLFASGGAMTNTTLFSSLLASALIFACGDPAPGETTAGPTGSSPSGDGDDTTGTADATGDGPAVTTNPDAPTTAPEPVTSGGTDSEGTTTSADDTDDGPCGFLCPTTGSDDDGGNCDVFAQDCLEGEKCAAFIDDGGGAWNSTKCVPAGGEGTPGDPCVTEGGGGSGLDDCQKGSMCWDVDTEGKGVCAELCGGSEAAPTCSDEASFDCVVVNEGVLNLCLANCDPLIQDCASDDLCVPVADSFVCAPDASADAGKVFDPCEFINVCDKGLYCLAPQYASECDANAGGCCLPFCDLADMNATCPGAGQTCTPWFDEGAAPPEYVNVGICIIPE